MHSLHIVICINVQYDSNYPLSFFIKAQIKDSFRYAVLNKIDSN